MPVYNNLMSLLLLHGFRNLLGENHFEFSRLWSSTNSCQVLIGVFFARKMHSTSEFAMTVLSKVCVCVSEHIPKRYSIAWGTVELGPSQTADKIDQMATERSIDFE